MYVPTQKELRLFSKAEHRPFFPQTSFDFQDILDKVRREYFTQLTVHTMWCFVDIGPLACIWDDDLGKAHIYIHQLFNHPETPPEVASLLFKHELLHLEILPREVDGKVTSHPPEFFTRLTAICPEGKIAWNWIWRNFLFCLHRAKRREIVTVERSWRSRYLMPRIGIRDLPHEPSPDAPPMTF